MGVEAINKEEREKVAITKEIKKLTEDGSNEKEIGKLLKEFGDKHADYGTDRKTLLEYHVSQIHRLLLPTQTTKMAVWTLHQEDEFYKVRVNGCFLCVQVKPGLVMGSTANIKYFHVSNIVTAPGIHQ